MKILVADDEVSVRVLVRRLLTKDFAVEIVEVPDGVSALNCLLSDTFDLLITDLAMPVMGGIETIASLRASPELAHLPVVVMTGNPDEEDFKRANALGIVGFVVKPFSVQDFRSRLDPIVRGLMPEREPEAVVSLMSLVPTQRLLIVDRAPEFTTVAESVLSRLCRVEVAKHEFAAIKSCMDSPPDAVVIGVTSALLSPAALAQKIRGLELPRPVRLLAAVPSAERAATEASGGFDAVLARETDEGAFEASVCLVVDDVTRARLLLHPSSSWLDEGLQATAQRLAKRAVGVTPTLHVTRPALDDAVRWVASDVTVQGRGFGWTLRVRCPLDVALEMARRDEGTRADEISEAHALRTVTALVAELAQQWCERARARDLRCEATAPSTLVQECLGSGADVETPRHARRWVSHGSRDLAILEISPTSGRSR